MDGRPRRSRSRPTAAHDGARGVPADGRYRRRGGAGPRPAAQRNPRRPLPRDEPRMRRGALPDARRRVPRLCADHRVRGRDHGPVRLRDHGAHPGQGGDGPRSAQGLAAARSAAVWCVAAGAGPAARQESGGHRQVAGPRARGEPACKRAAAARRARGGRPMIPESWYLTLSAALFTIGVVGVVIRRNPLVIFMSIELALNAANLALVAFGQRTGNPDGQALVFFVMAVAAAEAAVGLAIIVAIFRVRQRLSVDELSVMRW